MALSTPADLASASEDVPPPGLPPSGDAKALGHGLLLRATRVGSQV